MSATECNGKNVYSKSEAERVKAAIGRGRRKSLRIYRCNQCFAWHLTKKDTKGDTYYS